MGAFRKLFGKGPTAPTEMAPNEAAPAEPSPTVAWAKPRTGDPASDSAQTVLASLGALCGHPVTGIQVVPLTPVPQDLGSSLEFLEVAQRLQALSIADPAEVLRTVAALQEQVEEPSDDARVWLSGLAWETRREAAVAMFRLGARGQVSGIAGDTWGYAILATAAVRHPDWDRRVDATVALKRVMLDEAAEAFDMTVNLTAGLLLSWLFAEGSDDRVRLAACWALEGIPYRSVNNAPLGWLTNWLIIRAAQLVREGRIEMQGEGLRAQFFALAQQAEAARTGPTPEHRASATVCDICNASITPPAGTVFTPDVFRDIVRGGFGPSQAAITHAVMTGATEDQFVEGWKTDLVESSTTPWLLCPSCATRAKGFMPVGGVAG